MGPPGWRWAVETLRPLFQNDKATPQPGVLFSAAHALLGGKLASNSLDLHFPKNK